MRRIGILGGTFNPIHVSHISLAVQAYHNLELEKVLIMPSNNPPHKPENEIASDHDRVQMIRLAIEGIEGLELSEFEMKREGTTYTSDTLTLLHEQNPDTEFFFIIGGDSLINFETWHCPETVLRLCTLVCTGRSDYSGEKTRQDIIRLTARYSDGSFVPRIIYLPAPLINVSSSYVRSLISFDMSVDGLVDERVIRYIDEHGLYRNRAYTAIIRDLEAKLKPGRFSHVMNVARTCVRFALSNDVDISRAYLAGLLHDSAKYLSDSEILAEAERLGYICSEYELKSPCNLLHSKIGAYYAQERYGVDDKEIFNAIFYHTTGRPGMTGLEKILFLADFLEPGRSFDMQPPLDTVRALACSDPDMACLLVTEHTLRYLKDSGNEENICPDTADTLQYYKALIESR